MLGYMSFSLPTSKLIKIQQITHILLLRPTITVCQGMSFWGKSTFCVSGHAQLEQFCHVLQSNILNVYHSAAYLFFSPFSSSAMQLQKLSHLQQSSVPLQFPLPDMVITTNATPHYWAFYFQGSGLPVFCCGTWSGSMCKVHIALKELRLLHLCHVKWPLGCLVMVILGLQESTDKAYLYD